MSRAHPAHGSHAGLQTGIHHFGFYRVDPAYRRLLPNEKVVAKQEFLSVIEAFNHRVLMQCYSLIGLNGAADLLLWRIGDLEALQEMAARAFSAGIGKHLSPSRSFLAAPLEPEAPQQEQSPRFMFLQPLARTAEWRALPLAERKRLAEDEQAFAKKQSDPKIRLLPAFGLDDQELIAAAETGRPNTLAELSLALNASASSRYLAPLEPTFACIRHELSDVLDHLG